VRSLTNFNPVQLLRVGQRDTLVSARGKLASDAFRDDNRAVELGDVRPHDQAVFSHGYNSGVSLGGEPGNRAHLLDYDQREINSNNVHRIDAANFTGDAEVDLFGCNCGNGIAATLAGHLGGSRRVGGFTGPTEFRQTPGGVEMVPTYKDDRKVWYPK